MTLKNRDGRAAARLVAVLAAAALVLTLGVTALAETDEPAPEPLPETELVEPVETPDKTETPDDPDEDPDAETDPDAEDGDGENAEGEDEDGADPADPENPDVDPEADPENPEHVEGGEATDGEAEPETEEPALLYPIVENDPDAFSKLSPTFFASVAAELAALDEEQKAEIVYRWDHNCLFYSSAEDMLSVYALDWLSPQAAYLLILANVDRHVAYINRWFDGEDSTYMDLYNEAYNAVCAQLNALETADLSDPAVAEELAVMIQESYAAMRWAEENEEEATGERAMFNVANTYWDGQAAADARALLAYCAELAA